MSNTTLFSVSRTKATTTYGKTKTEQFTSDVNVTSAGTHGEAGQQTALNQLVGIFAHDLSVLARACAEIEIRVR